VPKIIHKHIVMVRLLRNILWVQFYLRHSIEVDENLHTEL